MCSGIGSALRSYTIWFNCLGHTHDENRLRALTDKLELICNWPTPSSYHHSMEVMVYQYDILFG